MYRMWDPFVAARDVVKATLRAEHAGDEETMDETQTTDDDDETQTETDDFIDDESTAQDGANDPDDEVTQTCNKFKHLFEITFYRSDHDRRRSISDVIDRSQSPAKQVGLRNQARRPPNWSVTPQYMNECV